MPENSSPNSDIGYKQARQQTRPKARTQTAVNPNKKPKAAAPKSLLDKFKASVTGPPTAAALAARDEFMKNVGKSDDGPSAMQGGIASLGGSTADADMYAENLKRYNEYMESQKQPAPTAITPEMREAALGMFESRQGAGQVPYYMAAARNADTPNMSPAFQYAAQNYDVLGGSQRLAPRPMEMMSVEERNRINAMSQAMADQAAQEQMAQNEYQQGMNAMTSGKGGPQTMAQPGVPPTQPPMPQYGGTLAAMLAKRFGNMG